MLHEAINQQQAVMLVWSVRSSSHIYKPSTTCVSLHSSVGEVRWWMEQIDSHSFGNCRVAGCKSRALIHSSGKQCQTAYIVSLNDAHVVQHQVTAGLLCVILRAAIC